ncbi:MAG: metallophosphoesterase [Ignavibacteriaceae bacterium]|nr:metallophosphoesterase [Ignavibacteriaceae bacterium]
MAIFFTIFFTVYAAVNYYIFIRGWQALSSASYIKPFYAVIFVVAALSYIAAKFLDGKVPHFLYEALIWIGSFWFAFMLYFFLSIVLVDFLRLLNWKLNFFPQFIMENYAEVKRYLLAAVVIISCIIILIGYLNTRRIAVNSLSIELPRKQSHLQELNTVVLSDLHLSVINDEKWLENIVSKINELNPDVVFIPGDFVDERAETLKLEKIGGSLSKIKTKYGVFASTGNHEFINGIKGTSKFITDNGINLIRDSFQLIENNFIVAGREDESKKNFTGEQRRSLNEIMNEVDKNYPVILLDHTPFKLEEAEANGVDLQLSGHTHHGQMFPLNFITKMIYEVSWGYKKKSDTHFYISCGVGTWGPPVRLGSESEIVNLRIKFK